VWLTAFVYSAVGSWNGGFNQLFAMLDRGWTLAWLVLLNGLVTAPLTYFLAARWGILGAMVGTCLFSVVVGAPLSPYLARSLLRAGK
jgi:O-antigen/teichoic acid export membrane protein